MMRRLGQPIQRRLDLQTQVPVPRELEHRAQAIAGPVTSVNFDVTRLQLACDQALPR